MLRAGLIEEAEERLDPKLDDQRRRIIVLPTPGVAWPWPRRNDWLNWCRRPTRSGC